MAKTIYKRTVLPWVLKWQLLLQTSSWQNFETKLICQSRIKPIEWKRYIDDVFSLWNKSKHDINLFIEQANEFHFSIKFTAEISENEITFLDTVIPYLFE